MGHTDFFYIFFKYIPSASYVEYNITWFDLKNLATPLEINKPYELNWTNINVYHVSAILKYVTVSFRFMKASRLYLQWMQFPQTFLCMNFNVKKDLFFSQKYLSGTNV